MQKSFKIKRNEKIDKILDEVELNQFAYDNQWSQYRIRVKQKDILESKEKIINLLKEEFTNVEKNNSWNNNHN